MLPTGQNPLFARASLQVRDSAWKCCFVADLALKNGVAKTISHDTSALGVRAAPKHKQ